MRDGLELRHAYAPFFLVRDRGVWLIHVVYVKTAQRAWESCPHQRPAFCPRGGWEYVWPGGLDNVNGVGRGGARARRCRGLGRLQRVVGHHLC